MTLVPVYSPASLPISWDPLNIQVTVSATKNVSHRPTLFQALLRDLIRPRRVLSSEGSGLSWKRGGFRIACLPGTRPVDGLAGAGVEGIRLFSYVVLEIDIAVLPSTRHAR
jgi:hypothetical protein